MARSINKRYTEYFIYLIFWGVLLFSPAWAHVLGVFNHSLTLDELLAFWKFLVPAFALFVVNNWILIPFFLYKRRGGYYILYILCVVMGLAMVYVFSLDDGPNGGPHRPGKELHDINMREGRMWPKEHIGDEGFVPMRKEHKGPPMKRPPHGPKENHDDKVVVAISHPRSVQMMFMVIVLVFNICVRMTFFAIRQDEWYRELEKEKLKTELDYLKYQINPHLFMNTLNNIHSLIDVDKEKAQKAVLELSKMMRYVLYDATTSLVPLDKELTFLNSYIDLMRLRYTDKLSIKVNFNVNDVKGVMVPSLLIIVFMENAFKHGVSYNKDSEIEVSIVVDAACEMIIFTCSNSCYKYEEDSRDKYKGIGIENARKRLHLLYGDKAFLQTSREGNRYNVVLKIPMNYDKVHNN